MIEGKGAVLRRNWWPILGLTSLAVVGFAWAKMASAITAVWGWLAIFFGLFFAPLFLVRNAFPLARFVDYRVTAERIELSGHEPIQNEEILEAKVLPRQRDALVVLALRDRRPITLRTTHAHAHSIVHMLGARRTRFSLVPLLWKRFLLSFAIVGLLSVIMMGPRALLLLPFTGVQAGVMAWLLGLVRGRLVVGADGFTVRWFFRDRFVPFSEVMAVSGVKPFGATYGQDTLVVLKNGKSIRMRTVEAPNTEEERGSESAAMVGHVQAAFHRSAQLVREADVPALVACQSRTARDWRLSIDALVRGGGSRYRVAAVSQDRLIEVATDPSAPAESRVGAAAALVRIGDDAFRTRVRVAAEACADSALRVSLLELADATDEIKVELALERFTRST